MSKIVSTRLNEDEISELNEIAEAQNLDRSAYLRKIILDQIRIARIQKMADHYRKGTISLQEAATGAHVSLYEMMEYVEREQIRPPIETPQEMEKEFARAQKFLKNLN